MSASIPGATPVVGGSASRAAGRGRVVIAWILIILALLVAWEGAKWLFGDPWRFHGTLLGVRVDLDHVPPFKNRIASDLALPHSWLVVEAFINPAQRNGPPLGLILFGQALFTFREALTGFVLGGSLGLLLGIGFVHSRLA